MSQKQELTDMVAYLIGRHGADAVQAEVRRQVTKPRGRPRSGNPALDPVVVYWIVEHIRHGRSVNAACKQMETRCGRSIETIRRMYNRGRRLARNSEEYQFFLALLGAGGDTVEQAIDMWLDVVFPPKHIQKLLSKK